MIVFYMLEVAPTRDPNAPQKERIAALKEEDRRNKAVRAFLKARGHKFLGRANAFATKAEAEEAIIQMGFPYRINICEAWG